MMRTLIAGATGFVGRALVERLLAVGHAVIAWVRSAERAAAVREELGAGVRPLVVTGPEDLAAALSETDAVVNLAGESIFGSRWTAARRRALVASRVDLTRQLVDALTMATPRPTVLVSASAVGYYGDRGQQLVDESAPAGDDFLAGLCRRWEQEALRAEALGVRVVLPRVGIVLGAGGALARMLPLFRAGLGGRLGSGRQVVSWIHLHDLCAALSAALDDERYRGPINATAPGAVTNRELTSALGRALARPTLLPVPRPVLRLALGAAATALLGGQRVAPSALRRLGFAFRFPTLDAALDDLLG
jgi:uncharacterized protein